jgi:phage repressor protein C with HTH and peptisase S24 domain
MDVVRKLILDRLQELDLGMAEVSIRLGRNETYLQQFLKRGSPRELHERDRIRLAEILSVSEDQLRGPSSILPKREYVKVVPNPRESIVAGSSRRSNLLENQQPSPDFIPGAQLVGEKDLPVFGTAQGGSGALIVTNEPVDWVVRPDPLLRVKDGYGMIITGDSMDPALKPGSIALINPHLPPRVGDFCLFRNHAEDGTTHAVIKEYRGETDIAWRVRQYSPAKDFMLKKSEWQVRHLVVGSYFS